MYRKLQKLLIVVTVNMKRLPMIGKGTFTFYIHLYCLLF